MKITIATFFALLAFMNAATALDLTPHEFVSNEGTPAVKRYYFDDEGKHLSFRIDTKMGFSVAGGGVSFDFDDLPNAAMKITHSDIAPAVPFDEKNIQRYRDAARGFLPPEAQNIQIEEEPNAIPINEWTSYQFTFAYELAGVRYRRSVTFLNYSPTEQLIVSVVATPRQYEKAYARGYRMLNSITDQPLTADGPT